MKPKYLPTSEDKKRLVRHKNRFKVSGDKVFATFQGEGLSESDGGTAGCPAVFFRLHYCNLHCGFPSGWKCDTGYTWDKERQEYWKESEDWTINQAKDEIEKSWNDKFGFKNKKIKRLVVTGGEPLIQQNLMINLLAKIPKWKIEIETNGTIEPRNELRYCQINCSPKLNNSGNDKEIRFRPNVLKKINNWPISWFKFVVNDEKDVEEIEEIVEMCQLKPERILIMPEGLTKEAVAMHRKKIGKKISKNGWRIIDRNQLIWFGPKRRT